MRKTKIMIAVAVAVCCLLGMSSAFAAAGTVDIRTSIGAQGDVTIAGTGAAASEAITVQVTDPSGRLDYIDQTEANAEGAFRFQYRSSYRGSGTYTAKIGRGSGGAAATATFATAGGGGSPSSGGAGIGSPSPSPRAAAITANADGSVVVIVAGAVDPATNRFAAKLGEDEWKRALELAKPGPDGGKTIVLKIEDGDAGAFGLQLPASALRAAAGEHRIAVTSALGTFILPSHMLEAMNAAGDDAVVEFRASVAAPEHAADRKVVEVSLLVNGTDIAWRHPNASVIIAVPYSPSGAEAVRQEHLVVVYIADDGERSPVPNGRYRPDMGAVEFRTNHFSKYAVAFVTKSFGDLADHAWAGQPIEVLASKGIVNGVSEEAFAPAANVSRADFTTLLVRTLELRAERAGAFTDVPADAYYAEAVGIAKALGIANGQGDGMFRPTEEITRQDMMTLTARALAIAGQALPANGDGAAALAGFEDGGDTAPYAREAIAALIGEGLVQGDGSRLHPLGSATRAETAVYLYRIYNRLH